ncbi:hypothetical protein [Blastococcus sp. PRF04-17]|uniref:hypothetical protein n=1 Tax=Blastococcus sp. PRF04-17 TaxID=2933797 RepID=UPI001FF52024|nr:hypothetical protein [Blastococcus sp. PRF04-17]UOY03435.1 hypothetical protein MVA48_08940 [Blastococcus sp. PRF04-17]
MPIEASVLPKPVVIEPMISRAARRHEPGHEGGEQERHERVEAGAQHDHDDGRDAEHECEEQLYVHPGPPCRFLRRWRKSG